ncbi:MAG: Lrp/AsnC family transcriptional regulator [Candidatus Thorarchaeota archaeon]|nr:Lrp/AsnC family transcriptional regulator [Candidatus Thorarchaeota archaeon]
MTSQREKIVEAVKKEHLTSIHVIADRLGLDAGTVREKLRTLVDEGELKGYITDDGSRFFRRDVEIKHKVKSTEEDVPPFMKFDPLPGRIAAAIGFIVVAVSLAGYLLSPDMETSNFMLIVLLIGIAIMLGGCYYLGTRKTPQ